MTKSLDQKLAELWDLEGAIKDGGSNDKTRLPKSQTGHRERFDSL